MDSGVSKHTSALTGGRAGELKKAAAPHRIAPVKEYRKQTDRKSKA